MKRFADIPKTIGRPRWAGLNPQALSAPLKSSLSRKWQEVSGAVCDQNHAVVLFDGKQEVGTLVRPEFLYTYYYKDGAALTENGLMHVEVETFRKDPLKYLKNVHDGYNLSLTKKGKPHLALVSLFVRLSLSVAPDGNVDFEKHWKDEFFEKEQPQSSSETELHDSLAKDSLEESPSDDLAWLFENRRPITTTQDRAALKQVFQALSEVEVGTIDNYRQAIAGVTFDPRL